MTLHDMGEVRNTEAIPSEPGSGNKKEKHYPTLSISSKKLAGLKNKKFGDDIELHIKGEIGGIREDYDDKTEAEYDIKIKECGITKGSIDKDEYEKMSEEEKDKADEKEVMEK